MENVHQLADPSPTQPPSWGTKIRHLVVHGILHADDRPHRLALGLAIGMFVAFTPTVGIQTLICLALAWTLSANRVVGLPLIWISNPATFLPIYYPCYRLGCQLTGYPALDRAWFAATVPAEVQSWSDQFGMIGSKFLDIAVPLWTGCLVVATVLGATTYFLMLALIRHHRARRTVPELDTMHESFPPHRTNE